MKLINYPSLLLTTAALLSTLTTVKHNQEENRIWSNYINCTNRMYVGGTSWWFAYKRWFLFQERIIFHDMIKDQPGACECVDVGTRQDNISWWPRNTILTILASDMVKGDEGRDQSCAVSKHTLHCLHPSIVLLLIWFCNKQHNPIVEQHLLNIHISRHFITNSWSLWDMQQTLRHC